MVKKEKGDRVEMNMRKSRTLDMLRADKTVFSVKMNTSDPRIVEIAAMLGIPCIWVDVEHTANDYSVTESQINMAKAYDTDVCVRVPRGSYSDYIRPLELDASGIMVPHVMSAEDAHSVVQMTRFYPIGRRPVDGGNADGRYGMIPQVEYNRQANENRFIILQIEDPEPLEEIDAMAEIEGYDMLFFGPGDFSHSIGFSGQIEHPEVQRAYELVAKTAAAHDKFAGTIGSPTNAHKLMDMGYNFINLGADVSGLGQYFNGIAEFIETVNNTRK